MWSPVTFVSWERLSFSTATPHYRSLNISRIMLSSTLIDELGYLPFEPQAAHLFFQLVSRRYERGSILITSNRSVGEWGEVFGDAVVATAILDRLLHHSHVLTITGESFRLREKRRAGVLKLSAPTPVNRPQKTR